MQHWKNISRDLIYMLIFGMLSSLLGLVDINIPSIEGGTSNLREIPLLVAIFHFSNPWPLIGSCFLSVLSTPPGGSAIGSFIMHSVSVLLIWIIFKQINKLKPNTTFLSLAWMACSAIYYLAFLLPLYFVSNSFFGPDSGKTFVQFYSEMVSSTTFEIFSTALITTLYLTQYDIRKILQKHKSELENAVRVRTEELVSTIEELKTTQNHLIQSSRMASLGTLTAGVAHEINNPLNFIAGGLFMIENKKDEGKSRKEEDCNELDIASNLIREGLERTKKIVHSLEAFTPSTSPSVNPCNIHQVIDDVLTFFNFKMRDIEVSKDFRLEGSVCLVPEKIHQVLMYILDNAIYAINIDAARPRKIHISTFSDDTTAIIKLSNSGPKIPEKNLSQIFDPFFTTKEPGHGPGIGLSICYTLINEHKGTIHVENEADWVTFTVELPLIQKCPE